MQNLNKLYIKLLLQFNCSKILSDPYSYTHISQVHLRLCISTVQAKSITSTLTRWPSFTLVQLSADVALIFFSLIFKIQFYFFFAVTISFSSVMVRYYDHLIHD